MTQKALLQSAGDGSAAPASYVGEVVGYYNQSFELLSGSSRFTAAPSISVSAGIFLVYGYYTISGTGPSGHGYIIGSTPSAPANQSRCYVRNVGFGSAEISHMNIIPAVIRMTSAGTIEISIWSNLSANATCNIDFQAVRIA